MVWGLTRRRDYLENELVCHKATDITHFVIDLLGQGLRRLKMTYYIDLDQVINKLTVKFKARIVSFLLLRICRPNNIVPLGTNFQF